MISRLGVLSVDASDLNVELVSDLLELSHLGTELWKSNVNRCSQSRTEVGWAGSDITEMVIMSELSNLLNLGRGL